MMMGTARCVPTYPTIPHMTHCTDVVQEAGLGIEQIAGQAFQRLPGARHQISPSNSEGTS